MARRAQAKYEISAEDKTKAALTTARQGMKDLQSGVLSLKGALAGLGAAFSFKAIIDNSARQQAAVAQLEAALRSTGNAVGYTREELVAMAGDLQKVTTFGDEAIIEAQARLVTYTGIVGTNFPRALQAVLDQSARLNIGLEQSAETIGKALESPMKAAAALADAGFGAAFTKEVRATIRAMVEAGKEAEAQILILDILDASYGGAAVAARDTFGGALKSLGNAFGDLLEADSGGLNDAKDALEELIKLLQDPGTVAAVNKFVGGLITGFTKVVEIVTGLNYLLNGPSEALLKIDDQAREVQKQIEALQNELARPRIFRINPFASNDELQAEIDTLRKRREELIAEWNRISDEQARVLREQRYGNRTGSGSKQPAAVSSPALVIPPIDVSRALLERQTALVRDEITRQQAALDRGYQDGLKSTAEYFQGRARLQQAALDAEIEGLRGKLREAQQEEAKAAATIATTDAEATSAINAITKAREQQIQIAGQITIAERNRAEVAGQAARDQAEAERDLEDQLTRVRIRLLELTGQTAEARKLALEMEYRDLVKRLGPNADAAGRALIRQLFNVEAARARLDEIQRDADLAFQQMATAEQTIDVQRAAGLLTETQARRQLVELHQQTAAEVQKLIPLMRELAEATGDPFAIERVNQLEQRIKSLALTADETAVRINGAFEDGLATLFSDVVTGAKNAEDAVRAFAVTFLQELARIASQNLASDLLGAIGGGGSGGLGGLISGFLNHSGGLAGANGSRSIPAIAFARAPRYHKGGIAGLAPDEVPAILKKREEVLTEDDPRHRNNGGLSAGGPSELGLKVVLVDDRNRIAQELASAEGDQAFVAAVDRNISTIRARLGTQ